MRRIYVLTIALMAAAVVPAVAQLTGMPVWNSPKGGTGVTISGDYSKPSDESGGGYAFGARAALGLGRIRVEAGAASWEPEGLNESNTSFGATAALRLVGGALMPVNVNVIAGAATASDLNVGLTTADLTTIVAGGGVSVSLPTPGFSIEPYLSVTNRWDKLSGADTESAIGWTLGANLGFGMLGLHVAYDSQERFGNTQSGGILGIGAHIGIGVPGL